MLPVEMAAHVRVSGESDNRIQSGKCRFPERSKYRMNKINRQATPVRTKKRSTLPYYICAFFSGNVMGALFTWSYFRGALSALFPTWTAGQLSTVFGIHNVIVVCVMLVIGQLIRKVNPKVLALIGGLMMLIGFGLFPLLPVDNPSAAYVMLIICFSCIAASASSFSGLIMMAVYPMWVPEHMGLVVGIAVTAANISPFYFGALCGVLIPAIGILRTVQIIGIIVFLMILFTLRWCRFPGPGDNLPTPKTQENKVSEHDYTLKEVLKSPLFWAFFLYCAFNRGCGLIMADLGGSIATAFGTATILGLIFSPASAVASITGGMAADKIGLVKTLLFTAVIMVLCGLALVLGNATSSAALLIIGIALGGFSYGAQMTISATATRVMFGNKYYGQNYSIINASIGIGAACGIFSGALIDNMGGAFTGVFVFVLALGTSTILLSLLIKGYFKKHNNS